MPNKLFTLLENKETANGTRALLTEIRTHQADMPIEVRDDITFGALVVLYDMGITRSRRLQALEQWSRIFAGFLVLSFLLIISLHAEIPWLSEILENILR